MKENINAFARSGMHLRLVTVVAGVVLATIAAVGFVTVVAFERAISPELEQRARLTGSLVRAELQRVLELGVPFEAVSGLERYLAKSLQDFEEVARISVVAVDGTIVAEADRLREPGKISPDPRRSSQPALRLPVLDASRVVGHVEVQLDPRVLQSRLRNVFLDVAVLAIAATLVAVELVLAIIAGTVRFPLEQLGRLLEEHAGGDFRRRVPERGISGILRMARRLNDHATDLAERFRVMPERLRLSIAATGAWQIASSTPTLMRVSEVGDIRIALFLYSAATEVATAFMPVFASAAERPDNIPSAWAAALPLLAYLLALAILLPLSGGLAARYGPRRLFLGAIVPTCISLAALANSESLFAIIVWRAAMAASYALATVSCQEYALRASADHGGVQGSSAFLSVIFAGVFCGSTLGGVLAGRFGFGAAFVAGATICVVAGLLGMRTMSGDAGDPCPRSISGPHGGRERRAWPGRDFIVLVLGVVVPMQATTAVVVWYLVPLMLAAQGAGPAEITRVVMIYYLASVAVGPVTSRLAYEPSRFVPLVAAGAGGAAVTLVAASQAASALSLAAAMAALGAAHALQRAPQYAIAGSWMRKGAGSLGWLRLGERVGAIVGLGCSALLLQGQDAQTSLAQLGAVVFSALVAFVVLHVFNRSNTQEEAVS